LDALVERGQIEAVMVIDEGVALLRLVRTGKRNGNSVEILSGLEGGEVIVSENPQDLVDGDKVEVQE
ncbi:MAG: hypothetical protein KDD60_08070, partial [Bdellovibrionales bacterium]|nr:hypothetical protein [Bdellovibrionales bacterium]